MEVINLKKGKHLIVLQVPGELTAGHLDSFKSQLEKTGFKFLVTQPQTEISVLTLQEEMVLPSQD